jgi:hypothetical protein
VTTDIKDEERLLQRIHHLRQIVAWADELQAQLGPSQAADQPNWARFEAALATAHKLLADQDDPEGKDRLRSAVEPDARRGKHGAYYDGYLCDISQDPDSELLTALQVLPANGDEAADARPLLEAEQAAHGNRIEALSIDSVGFQGPLLRDLSDPTDLNLTVYVPPHSQGIPTVMTRIRPRSFTSNVLCVPPVLYLTAVWPSYRLNEAALSRKTIIRLNTTRPANWPRPRPMLKSEANIPRWNASWLKSSVTTAAGGLAIGGVTGSTSSFC